MGLGSVTPCDSHGLLGKDVTGQGKSPRSREKVSRQPDPVIARTCLAIPKSVWKD